MKLSLSAYCKEKDRIKEELKWKRQDLEDLEEEFKNHLPAGDCNFGDLGDIEILKEEIQDLENEWSLLHGDKK